MKNIKGYIAGILIDVAITIALKSRFNKQADDISKLQSGLSNVADRVLDLEQRGNMSNEQ